MKKFILDKTMNSIKKDNPNYDEEKLEIIRYGLEGIYLTITKLIIIILLSILLKIFKYTLLVLLFYNILRTSAFGMHAKKSSHCLIMSTTLFIGGTYLAIYLTIPLIIKIILSIICLILVIIYAPADTEKRPLINKKKRIRFKILSILTSLIFTFLIIYYKNYLISNCILIGYISSTIMILPITYKIFKLPYNNYLTYK